MSILKSKLTVAVCILFFAIPFFSFSQSADLENKISSLSNQVENLTYTLDVLKKGIDDILFYQKLEDIAYVDKVRITGPPSAKVSNSTGKGVKNPLLFYTYVFIPKDIDPSKKYPLIVLPHGGVHGNFGLGNVHILRELLAQGYIVTAPEYRGSTGYGKRFQQQIDYGGLEVADTKASRDYMVENYSFVDQNRIGVIGWSHGGMHALMNLFEYPDAYQVGYAGVPVSDLVMRLGYMNNAYRKLFSADYHIGKEVFQNVEEYKKRSPVWNVQKLTKPVLIYGNTNDDDVLVLEVEHLVRALKAEGKKFDYEIFEDFPGGHHFDRIDNHDSKGVRLKIYQYLEKYLKPNKPFNSLQELIRSSYYPH